MSDAIDDAPERFEVLVQPYGRPGEETVVSFGLEEVELPGGVRTGRVVDMRTERPSDR